MPRPKGEQLEASHGQLGDLVAHGCPSRLLDGTAGILDGVIVKFSKDIDGRDHLVIVERLSSTLIKHEDALKHGGRGTANRHLDRILDHPRINLFVEVKISQVTLALAIVESGCGLAIDYQINKSIESIEVGWSLHGRSYRSSGLTAVSHAAGQS